MKKKDYIIDKDAVGHEDIIEGKEPLKKKPKDKIHNKVGLSKGLKERWELLKAKIIDHNDNFHNIVQPDIKEPEIADTDVSPQELEMGTTEEMEHTDDEDVAKKIALQHLQEDPVYYSKLRQAMPPKEATAGEDPNATATEGKDVGNPVPEATPQEAEATSQTPENTPQEAEATPQTTPQTSPQQAPDEHTQNIIKQLLAGGVPQEEIDKIMNGEQQQPESLQTPEETQTPESSDTGPGTPEGIKPPIDNSVKPKTIDDELDEIEKIVKLKELKLKSVQLDKEMKDRQI